MHAPYRQLYTMPTVPDMPVDPPELSGAEYDRNMRNWCREEALEAIDKLVSNLDELEHDGRHRHTQKYLEDLRRYLSDDIEA